jgi:hypothetical protein
MSTLTPRMNNIETGGAWKIGDIKHSFLDETQFQAEHDDTWILCDGQTDITGSDLHAVTGWTSTPDTRGQFLRGLDTSGTVDPDGAGRVLGDTQAESVGQHTHDIAISTSATGANGGGNRVVPGGTTTTELNTGVETRPKNIVCNMYIKVNRNPSI